MKRGVFLKKSSAVTINLRKLRPLFLAIAVSLVLMVSIVLSKSLPAIRLSEDSLRFFLSSNVAFSEEVFLVSGAFSFKEKAVLKESSPDEALNMPSDVKTLSTPLAKDVNSPVEISDTTDSGISYESFLSPSPPFMNDSFSVLIVHTHTTESYTPSEKHNYTPSDTDRTTDSNFNMVKK